MIEGVLPNAARDWVLAMRIGRRNPETLVLKLFTNQVAVNGSMQASDLDEPVGQGYQAVPLVPLNWTLLPATDDSAAVATYPEVIFTFLGPLPEPVRGYFLVGADTGDLVGMQSFDEPRPIQFMGDQERVTVSLLQW